MKSQIAGQVFIYAITLVIVAAILLFGYQSISEFKSRSNDVDILQFRQDLESSVKSISGQYGTLKIKEFRLGSDYKELCFLNNHNFNIESDLQQEFSGYPLLLDSLGADFLPTSNIFLLLEDHSIAESYTIGFTDLAGNFKCFPTERGMFTVRMEGKGDYVVIS